ncbi:BREX protein BrxB domain-containing protein [Oerskovia sp. M15]
MHSMVKDIPVVTWFPGTYEQSDTQGSSLALFGLIHDDQYYRARDIRFQEA